MKQMELRGIDFQRRPDYFNMVRKSAERGTAKFIDNVRYMMAIAYNSSKTGFPHQVSFFGGLGVLAHLVNIEGEEAISQWRGTQDLDIFLSNRQAYSAVRPIFDEIDFERKDSDFLGSNMIRGRAYDRFGRSLETTDADLVYAPGRISESNSENDFLRCADLENTRITNFFGVPVCHTEVLPLLRMKLNLLAKKGVPRIQDTHDVGHLIGVCEAQDYLPSDIESYLSHENLILLDKIMTCMRKSGEYKGSLIVAPSGVYRDRFSIGKN
jgi:hypothetical protein